MTKSKTKLTLKQRIFSGLLAVVMIAGIFGTWPITIFAEESEAQYVPVADLGYKSNAEAIADGHTIYLDLWYLWGSKGYLDKDGNECPQWVAYTDETVYISPAQDDSVSGKFVWENYSELLEIGNGYGYEAYLAILVKDVCEHNYVMFERMDATCTTDGYIGYSCDKCDAVYEEKLLAFGHKYENGACVVCGYDSNYVSVESLGYESNQAALDAGEILYLNLYELDHELLGWGIDTADFVDENGNPLPNYIAYNDTRVFNTIEGWKNGDPERLFDVSTIWYYIAPNGPYASLCEPGGTYSDWIVVRDKNAHTHDYVEVERVEPTCATQGYILYSCTICGGNYKDVIPSPSHEWAVSETCLATCTEDGYTRYICAICSEQYEETLSALGHEAGLDGYCSNCGQHLNAPKVNVWDGTVANGFGGGSGTAQDPYLIYTGAELAYLASSTNNGYTYSGKYFKLMNDIDLNGIEWTPIGRGLEYDSSSYAFGGNFDGNGMLVSNLTINSSRQFTGLFGVVFKASISNLGIDNAHISVRFDSEYCLSGGLVGAVSTSQITNCYTTNSTISAVNNYNLCAVGGLFGAVYSSNEVKISNCFANCEVTSYGTGNSAAGGLIGIVDWDGGSNVYRINSCYSMGTVYSNCSAGGFIGLAWSDVSYINHSFANSKITGGSQRGAFIGRNNSASLYMSGCYYGNTQSNSIGSAVSISAENFKSYEWIATNLGWDFNDVWTFDNSNGYEYPVLQGFGAANGGNNHPHQYSETEKVEATCKTEGYIRYTCSECGVSYTETLPIIEHQYTVFEIVEPTCVNVGYTRYTCSLCGNYYDETIPAIEHQYSVSEVVEPTCKAEGYTRYTCSLCGDYYDEAIFALGHTVGKDNYCTECGEYVDAPVCDTWDGTVNTSWYSATETVFIIETAEQLAGLAKLVNAGNTFAGKTIYLAINLDLSGYNWTPIGTRTYGFAGTFDGRGHTIDSMTIEGNYANAGLFGKTYNAHISNVGLTNVNIDINGSDSWLEIGALIGGQNGGITSGCFMQGTVRAHNANSGGQLPIGGLIGVLGSGGVTDCYAISTVVASGVTVQAGGLIGTTGWYHDETTSIKNCFAISNVSASGTKTSVAGGLVADNYARYCTLNSCFVRNCTVTSKQSAGTFYGRNFGGSLTLQNCYYSESNVSETFGATHTSIENLKSQSWIESTLGWDFDTIWDFETGDGLPGFGGSSGGGGNACDHNYIETVTPPTCTEEGYTTHVCSLCNDTYKDHYVPRNGHTPSGWVIDYESTCTSSGRKHSECTVCGQQLENIYIAPLGHNYVTVVTREVTCTTPGILTHTCERCGINYSTYVYSEHAYAITEQVQPDCYTDGYTVYTCSNCQDEYTETIPGGHDYKSAITKVATSEEDGEITYTCATCGDFYTQVIPAREAASVLLVQDRYPWSENNNVALLDQMLKDGYITGWDMTTTSNFENMDLGMYNVILIANDQSSATYSQLQYLSDTLVQFATAGGVIIYGACDSGWAGGNINYTLPEGVVKKNFYSRYNYIVDTEHLIISGVLTDGKALTNNLLYGNYCSHSAFDANSLPADANVILQDAHGDATLVEYAVGDGYVILSGLTWEFYYNRNCYDGRTNTSYTKNVYDDLIVYTLNLSDPCDHIYNEGEVIAPTCTEDGYTLHTCQNCGAKMKDEIVEKLGHVEGEWEVTLEATQYTEGLKELRCTVCGEVLGSEVLPPVGGAAARVEGDFDNVVVGEEIEFIFVIENCEPVQSLTIVPTFDTSIFEIVSVEWLLGDAVTQTIEDGTFISVSVWNDFVDVNGAVYRIVLKAKETTNYISIGYNLKVNDREGLVTVVPQIITVKECTHTNTKTESLDDTYHALVCTNCGHVVMEEHIFDDIYDVDCNECEYKRPLRGDVDNDGDVDEDDCVYLIYSVFFGTIEYPVYQNLDFDGDGIVCSEDGVYLLRYIYYGAGEYPLY